MKPLLIRNAEVEGRQVDVAIAGERIVAVGPGLAGEELLDARGGAVIPGLHDHHIHLLATAAQRDSVRLEGCADLAAVATRLGEAAAHPGSGLGPGRWLRATGYHERVAGPLDRQALDRMAGGVPLRVQHQTGGLWMVNSAGLALLGGGDWPDGAERDEAGAPTGRFFRCDEWLRQRIGAQPPDLAALGAALAASGITGVTDASVSTDASAAALLAEAVRDGALPLGLTLMSGGALAAPEDGAFAVGPLKLLLDDHALPDLDAMVARIGEAREQARSVAVHCVTAAELALTLAAFSEAGTRPGDRIEHGSVIPREAIPVLRELGLTVVTQPGFVATRGERYRALVDPAEQPDLYRCASLIAAGVPVGGSSDAPYGEPDPWAGIAAALSRRTAQGHVLGPAEAVAPRRALALYLTAPKDPGGAVRRIAPGARADLCVLEGGLDAVLAAPDRAVVRATMARGRITCLRS